MIRDGKDRSRPRGEEALQLGGGGEELTMVRTKVEVDAGVVGRYGLNERAVAVAVGPDWKLWRASGTGV